QTAEIFARLLDGAAENVGIGACEVDVLESALRERLLRRVALTRHAFGADDHHLTGLDVVQVDSTYQIEGTRLGSEYVAFALAGKFHFAHTERTEAMRVARHNDTILREKDQRERTFQLEQSFA